jgi:hypothetical protein
MANTWKFEMKALQKVVEISFKRHGTSLPENIPFALTRRFLDNNLESPGGDLATIISSA